ncbi:MAG: hypothetical protein PX637_05415 [Microcystis sp. M53601_WE4]|nr:hypothetical protein [Microcystis sp. M53601_WE4]
MLLQFGKIFPLSLFPDCLTIFLSSDPLNRQIALFCPINRDLFGLVDYSN